ncbi:MAG TPA: hypothetical protein VHZ54_02960 [Solirubrobacterales bacterium]|jgi:hypothetical protein|nr:hypothetical protein [Solirubrobacterales bacterium]
MVWSEYIVLARRLAGCEFEAADRSAVSRAYYGAFNLARRWHETHVGPIVSHRAHAQVWEAFIDADRATLDTRKDWLEVGELGYRLRKLRNLADYTDSPPGLEEAADAVVAAERIMGLLPALDLAD